MERSLLYQLGGEEGDDFETLCAEVALAEELGLAAVWCLPAVDSEGGFVPGTPPIWLSGLASRTERIRLGWGIAEMLPPTTPPFRVAEQVASLDQASDGRVDIAVLPSGELDPDPSPESKASWQEGYRMLVDMWDAPRFSWTSERFDVKPVDVVPKPIQDPHPPLWLVGWSEAHARAAGRGGLGYLDVSGAPDDQLELHRDAYTASRAECEPEDLVCIHVFGVAGDFDPGEEAAQRLARWEALGVDQALLRVGALEGGSEQSKARIRFLAEASTGAGELH